MDDLGSVLAYIAVSVAEAHDCGQSNARALVSRWGMR